MKREETVDFNVKATWHAIARMYNQYAARHGITTSMGFVLLNINGQEGTPATKIAPLMGLEARSLTRILRSMEKKQLIARAADPADKRMVRICLTEKGRRKKERAREAVLQFNEAVREIVPQTELAIFFNVLRSIHAIVEKTNSFATVD
jgi:MarR family transcriptional regulator, organic hydroperoxide resistance regulator